MVKIGKEITLDEYKNKLSLNEDNDENIHYCTFFPRDTGYFPGTIILLEKGEKLSSIIDKIDTNIEKLGLTYYRSCDFRKPRNVSIENDPIDLTDVKFENFPNLKVCDIQWSSIGINNDTFNNCKNLEILNLSTPLDYPFDKDNCSSLYTLTNLKILNISGYGAPMVGEGFYNFATTGYANKEFEYNFVV